MPVPSVITDLSTTAGSNSPAGTDAIGTALDNYLQAHASFVAQLRDGSKNLELGTSTAPSCAFTGDSNTGIYSPGADIIALVAGGSYWRNVSGIWSNASQTQPSFRALASANRATNGTFSTYNEIYDQGSYFNASSGVFTVPVTGIYLFTFSAFGSALAAAGAEVGLTSQTASTKFVAGDTDRILSGGGIVRLSASDTVGVQIGSSTGTYLISVTEFCGHFLG